MKIVIAGGTHEAEYIVHMFHKRGNKLVVINPSKDEASLLLERESVRVYVGDPWKGHVLEEADAEDADLFISLCDRDTDNYVTCQNAKKRFGAKRCICVVAEGRRVVNNITKSATLYLTKNIFSLLLALFSMVSVLQYPLQPSQITLISMFAIGIPSFILALEPNNKKIKGSFLGNVFKMATPAGITVFLSVSALLIFGDVMKIQQDSLSTAAAALGARVEFMILARVAQPMTKMHLIMMASLIAGFFYAIIFHNELFGISDMTWQTMLLLIVFLIATQAVFRYFYRFTTFVGMLMTEEGRNELREKNGGKLIQIHIAPDENRKKQ